MLFRSAALSPPYLALGYPRYSPLSSPPAASRWLPLRVASCVLRAVRRASAAPSRALWTAPCQISAPGLHARRHVAAAELRFAAATACTTRRGVAPSARPRTNLASATGRRARLTAPCTRGPLGAHAPSRVALAPSRARAPLRAPRSTVARHAAGPLPPRPVMRAPARFTARSHPSASGPAARAAATRASSRAPAPSPATRATAATCARRSRNSASAAPRRVRLTAW